MVEINDKVADQSYGQAPLAPGHIVGPGADEVETARQVLASQDPDSHAYFSALDTLAGKLMSRFALLRNPYDLDEAIVRTKEVLDLAPPGHSSHALALSNMGQTLIKRFKFRGEASDLTQAVSYFEAAVASCTPEESSYPDLVGNLCSSLLNRYWICGDVSDLDRIIETGSTVLSSSPTETRRRDALLNNLAIALKERFVQQRNIVDLNAALGYHQSCLDLRPLGHPLRYSALGNLADAMILKYEVDGHLQDLENAANHYVSALQLCSPGQEGYLLFLTCLGSVYWRLFLVDGKVERLRMAIGCYEIAMEHSKAPNLDHSRLLDNYAAALLSRYTLLGSIGDLNQAIQYLTTSSDILPQTYTGRPTTLLHLGVAFVLRFNAIGNIVDLDSSIEKLASALQLCTPSYYQRPFILSEYGNALCVRSRERGDIQDLNLAASICKDALALSSPEQPAYSSIVANLTAVVSELFYRSGNIEECQTIIDRCDRALVFVRPGEPAFFPLKINRAKMFLYKFQDGREEKDIETCIDALRETIPAIPEGHIEYVNIRLHLGNALNARFELGGDENDLNESIAFLRVAHSNCKRGNLHYTSVCMRLGNALRELFEYHHDADALDEAVVLLTEAEEILSPGQIHYKTSVVNLGIALSIRFQTQRNRDDLDTAIERVSHALTLPAIHEEFLVMFTLATFLLIRYSEGNDLMDLERCVELFGVAEEQMPPKHTVRGNLCRNYGDALMKLGCHRDQLQNFDAAFIRFIEAINHLPASHVDQSLTCLRLADLLQLRARLLLRDDDMNQAMMLLQGVLRGLPEDSPMFHLLCYAIARLSMTMYVFSRPQVPSFLEHSFQYYAKAARYTYARSGESVRTALEWTKRADEFHHSSALLAYETSLDALNQHLLAAASIKSQHVALVDKQWIRQTSTLATDATACAIGLGKLDLTVELSEQGRGLLWSQLSQSRTPLDALRSASDTGRALAFEFERVSTRLVRSTLGPDDESYISVMSSRLTIEEAVRRHRQLSRELEDIIARIHSQEGFQSFLGRPSFESLQRAAICGPVILVNVSRQRCDAVIVLHDTSPRLVPLPEMSLEVLTTLSARYYRMLKVTSRVGEEKMREREVVVVLRTLWDTIVRPIVDELTPLIPRGARIWWCPTSKLTTLPLHAAGPYRKGAPNLPNIYVSSYTPTLAALIRARHQPSLSPTTPPAFIAIGQAKPASSNGPALQTVSTELTLVQSLLPSSPPSVPFSFSTLDKEMSTAHAALAALATHDWVHLACHGYPNVEKPFDSAFALSDRRATVLDIVRTRGVGQVERRDGVGDANVDSVGGEERWAPSGEERVNTIPGEFAFLSACHTAVGDQHAPDEVIHLAAAMQFVGFRSVIGTMWAVDDGMAQHIVRAFYECMFAHGPGAGGEDGRYDPWDSTRAARALNKAAKLVDKDAVSLDQRIVFIHIGA